MSRHASAAIHGSTMNCEPRFTPRIGVLPGCHRGRTGSVRAEMLAALAVAARKARGREPSIVVTTGKRRGGIRILKQLNNSTSE